MALPLPLDFPTAIGRTALVLQRAAVGLRWAQQRRGVVALTVAALVAAVLGRAAPATWWTVWAALALGQLAAQAHAATRGGVFAHGLRPWNLLGGIALAFWVLLLFEPAQRWSQRLAYELAQGTPWLGVATGLAWCLLVGCVPLLVLAALLLWRLLAQAVLEAKVSATVPHELMWVGLVSGLAADLQVAAAPVGWGHALDLGGAKLALVEQQLSLFIDEYGAAQLALLAAYTLVQLLLARPPRSAAPPLFVFDLRPWTSANVREARALHALAWGWGEARGGCVLVRSDAHAMRAAGAHLRWADAAGRSAELFAAAPGEARRWCAGWLPSGRGPFIREVFLGNATLLHELAQAAQTHAPGAHAVIIAGSWADAGEVERLRLAWPKPRAVVLVDSGLQASPIARVATLVGELSNMRQRRRLLESVEQRMRAPAPSRSVAVLGRPRWDRAGEQLAALLDQRLVGGMRLDVQRPARESNARFDQVLLLVDPAWLAGDAEAGVEAAALQTLVQPASQLAVIEIGPGSTGLSMATLRAALKRCGWSAAFSYHGRLSEDPQRWAYEGAAERFAHGVTVELPEAAAPVDFGVFAADGLDEAARAQLVAGLNAIAKEVALDPAPGTPLRALVLLISPRQAQAWNRGIDDALSQRVRHELARATPCVTVLLDDARLSPGPGSLPLVGVLVSSFMAYLPARGWGPNENAMLADLARRALAAGTARASRTPPEAALLHLVADGRALEFKALVEGLLTQRADPSLPVAIAEGPAGADGLVVVAPAGGSLREIVARIEERVAKVGGDVPVVVVQVGPPTDDDVVVAFPWPVLRCHVDASGRAAELLPADREELGRFFARVGQRRAAPA